MTLRNRIWCLADAPVRDRCNLKRHSQDFLEVLRFEGLEGTPDGNVPRKLQSPLFVGPEATYVILDTAVVNGGLLLFEDAEGFHGSLATGEISGALADVMPCLASLAPDSDLSRKLFRHVPGQPSELASLHLWPSNVALFLRSHAEPEALKFHLRRFIKPAAFSGRRRYLRLFNPAVAFDYFSDLERSTQFMRCFMSTPEGPLTVIARKGGDAVSVRALHQPLPADRPVLEDLDLRALTLSWREAFHSRLCERLVRRGASRGYDFDRDAVTDVARKVMRTMENHTPEDVPNLDDHMKLALVLLLLHPDAVEPVLTGPVIRNTRLGWAQRVDIVAKSYLTGLRRMNGMKVV